MPVVCPPVRRPPSWLRLALGNLLLLGVLAALVFVAGELYYRFVYDEPDGFGVTLVEQAWMRRHYRLNRAGIRDSIDEYAQRPLPGRPRITFFGDSFTNGHGVEDVEERFANRIRARRPDWEVHVFAAGGLDTGHHLEQLQRFAEVGYGFDHLVLVNCLNDIADLVPEWEAIRERIWNAPDPGFWVRNSFFVNLVYYRWKARFDPALSDYFYFVREAYAGPIWEQQAGRLQRIRDVVHGAGGRLRAVTFPFVHALGPDYRFAVAHERLGARWRELGVPHLDLLRSFEALEASELVVSRHDPHPNERAHELASHAIEGFLQANLQAGRR